MTCPVTVAGAAALSRRRHDAYSLFTCCRRHQRVLHAQPREDVSRL